MPLTALLSAALLLPQGTPDAPGPRLQPPPATSAERASLPPEEGPAGLDAALWRETRDAADRGLDWLAARQAPGGYWLGHVGHKQGDNYLVLHSAQANDARGSGHIGVTALAGMAFLAGGHLPDRGRHGQVVRRALDYILAQVTDSGLVTDGGSRMYSHAFATLFLAEIHGMDSSDARVRPALERAVHLVVDCQNAQGGWRYNAFTPEADMSVTVCQLQALRAARNIGIRVPRGTIDAAMDFVRRARTRRGLFFYKNAGRSARTKDREFAINAAASTALLTAGITDPELHDPVLEFLDRDYQFVARYYPTHYFYYYGNYYACQAFFHAGGARFDAYQQRLVRDLLRMQRGDGSWPNDVGPGDTFGTAVASLLLQVPKQYLPIFQR
jgi:hypothetical protein